MSMPMLAGVGLLVVCCSSSSAMMMMGGGDGDDSAAGAGAGAGAVAKTHSTPVLGKIYHTDNKRGWHDPGGKTTDGHIAGTSLKDCFDKAPEGAVIAGWRSDAYADPGYEGTCFYYKASQGGAPVQEIAEHSIACMDSTKDVNKGCGVPRITNKIYSPHPAPGWNDPGSKPNGGIVSSSLEECITKAPTEAKIVGFRDGAYADPGYENTCFYYNQTQGGLGTQDIPSHHLTCKDQSKSIGAGCV